MRSQQEREEQAEETRSHLLQAEAAGLALVLRRRKAAIDEGLRRGLSVPATGVLVQTAVRRSVAESRALARRAGVLRLQAEVASIGAELGDLTGVVHLAIARDIQRAGAVAKSYAERWVRNAQGATVKTAAAKASAATSGSLRRIAVTESAESFNTGREQAVREAQAPRHRHSLLKVWDATLDRRTCPICRDADGDIVGYHEPFPAGTPGSVHPFDRCTWRLLTSEEAGDGALILPAST